MRIKKLWFGVTLLVIFGVSIFAYFYFNGSQVAPTSYSNSSRATDMSASSSSTTTKQSSNVSTSAKVDSQTSSLTTNVGAFAVTVNCIDLNPFTVTVTKGGLTIQSLNIQAEVSGVHTCPQAKSQDINFDGYPDFMILSDTGSGGSTFKYWLFNTDTKQFYCPEAYNNCSLMNPIFDLSSKTVTSIDYTGAGSTETKIYEIVDGRLVLSKDIKK